MDARNLLSLSGVLMILGGALYYWGMGQSVQQLSDLGAQLPDYEVAGVESWQTDEHGLMLKQIQATSARHFRGAADRTVVSQPVMTLYREGQPAWRVSAHDAVGTDQNREVHLFNQVHAERLTPDSIPVQADMASLDVHTEAQTMDTKDEVTVRAGSQSQLQSRGLDADMKADTMNLHSEVHGIYVTQHP